MGFSSLDSPAVDSLIDRFAAAGEVTLVVGAGASMEASLPSWRDLIERLLKRVADDHPAFTTEASRQEWIERTMSQDDLLAAGAIVEVMASEKLDRLLPAALFGTGGAAAFEPGPIAHQVAYLRTLFEDRLTILTTNYDDLIERALVVAGEAKKNVKSYVQRRTALPAETIPVTHLHGYAGRDSKPKRLVLTEEHYHRMQRGHSWQEQYVTDRLENSLCLFVGTSLNDPNLIRYLYGYGQSKARAHAAVFVRQGDPQGASDEVRAVREEAVVKRWARCGVEAVFVDHFGDAAQLLHEVGYKRSAARGYRRPAARARVAVESMRDTLLLLNGSQDEFATRQVELSRWLRETLYETLGSVGAVPAADEHLALALWLASGDGETITGWAHSDRAHQDPSTIEAVPVTPASEWVAVRTVCQGVPVQLNRQSEVSRWRFVRGLPLVVEEPARLPIGCLTISSTKPRAETVLVSMSDAAREALDAGLVEAVQPELDRLALLVPP